MDITSHSYKTMVLLIEDELNLARKDWAAKDWANFCLRMDLVGLVVEKNIERAPMLGKFIKTINKAYSAYHAEQARCW